MSSGGDAEIPPVREEDEGSSGNSGRCWLITGICLATSIVIAAVTAGSVCGVGLCGRQRSVRSRTVGEIEIFEACSLAQCFLVDTETRDEVQISGNFAYLLDPNDAPTYSIRCNPRESLNFLDFFYDGQFHRESNEPFFMEGNSGEFYIEPVWQLSRCGNKSFRIATKAYQHAGQLCSEEIFELTAVCSS